MSSEGHKENPKSKQQQHTKKKEKKIPIQALASWADDVDETVAKSLEPKSNTQRQEHEQAPSSPSYQREERRYTQSRRDGDGEGGSYERRGGYGERRGGGGSYERRGGYNERRSGGGDRERGERRNYESSSGGGGGSYERRGGYSERRGGGGGSYERRGGNSYERRAPEGEGEREREREREREQKPVPTEPPFTAYVGNLSYDCTEEDLKQFFYSANCSIVNIKLVSNPENPNKHKGFGYVEFATREDLEAALQGNNYDLKGRLIKIDVADQPEKRVSKAETSERWNRKDSNTLLEEDKQSSSFGPRRDSRSNDSKRQYNFHEKNENRYERNRPTQETSTPSEKKERPKLNLQPRTNPEPVASTAQKTKTDPFGGAKPREEKLSKTSSSSSSSSSTTSTSSSPSTSSTSSTALAVSPSAQRKEEEKPQPKEAPVSETKPKAAKPKSAKQAKASNQGNNPYGALQDN